MSLQVVLDWIKSESLFDELAPLSKAIAARKKQLLIESALSNHNGDKPMIGDDVTFIKNGQIYRGTLASLKNATNAIVNCLLPPNIKNNSKNNVSIPMHKRLVSHTVLVSNLAKTTSQPTDEFDSPESPNITEM
jgi:hypothetical protein